MIYARVHDQTVADDYYTAMERVERRLDLIETPQEKQEVFTESERGQVFALIEELAEPELSPEVRLVIVAQIRLMLLGEKMARNAPPP